MSSIHNASFAPPAPPPPQQAGLNDSSPSSIPPSSGPHAQPLVDVFAHRAAWQRLMAPVELCVATGAVGFAWGIVAPTGNQAVSNRQWVTAGVVCLPLMAWALATSLDSPLPQQESRRPHATHRLETATSLASLATAAGLGMFVGQYIGNVVGSLAGLLRL